MLAVNLAALAVSLAGALTVHRWLAVRWFGALEDLTERELLLHGLLMAVLINGVAGTYLGLLHMFHPAGFALFFLACIFALREHARAVFAAAREAVAALGAGLRALRALPLIATLAWLLLAGGLLLLNRMPTENVDAWSFQLPLAFSVAEHHGLVYPQIDHPFYPTQPLFVNLLFAQALAVYPDYTAAGAVSVLIYVLTLLSLATLWPARAWALCLLLLAIGANFFFTAQVPAPLTDLPRSCLSVLGLVYAAAYLERRIACLAGFAALCLGAAVATKYTELLGLGLAGALMLPTLNRRDGWIVLGKCAAVVAVAGSTWYLKNLLLFGNPLYPFLFGHPGITDAWMADYMGEMTRAFDPALRGLNHDLLSMQGWRDFAAVMWDTFFGSRRAAIVLLALALAALPLAPKRIGPLLMLSAFLFLFWYRVMFNHVRWAIPAYLLLHVAGCWGALVLTGRLVPAAWLQARLRMPVAGAALAGLAGLAFLAQRPGPVQQLLARPGLADITAQLGAALRPDGVAQYLAARRPGYAIYRHIAGQNLRGVFQPYDSGAAMYAAAYNGGADGGWLITIDQVPARLDSLEAARDFIRSHAVAYFITRDDLNPIETDRLGADRLAAARQLEGILRPGATLLLEDTHGWRLYRAGPAAGR